MPDPNHSNNEEDETNKCSGCCSPSFGNLTNILPTKQSIVVSHKGTLENHPITFSNCPTARYTTFADSLFLLDNQPLDIGILSESISDAIYINIETFLGKGYTDPSNTQISSNVLDVIAVYIKGQKLLYTEAKTYCEQQLNFLMLPAIFISCVSSIFSFLSSKYSYGPIIIASLNGFNAFLLALISYLKLDAKAQAHKTSAYKFDKLESICEFNSGKFMFFQTCTKNIEDIVEKIETGVKDIKETNQFILPESIRYEFHFTYTSNIFTLVKRMQLREITLLNKLKILKDRIDKSSDNKMEERLRGKLVEEIFELRKGYYELDKRFNAEIEQHRRRMNKWVIFRIVCCDWLKS